MDLLAIVQFAEWITFTNKTELLCYTNMSCTYYCPVYANSQEKKKKKEKHSSIVQEKLEKLMTKGGKNCFLNRIKPALLYFFKEN